MNRKIKDYGDMPVGKLQRIENFLPPPEKLVFPEESVKVTIALNKKSVDFLKQKAKIHNVKYQRMIRQLIDRYVGIYSKSDIKESV